MTPLPDAIQRLTSPSHVCSVYRNQDEQLASIVPFLQTGLERGERCACVMENEGHFVPILQKLREHGLDVDHAMRSGALVPATTEAVYLRGGKFDPAAMLTFWKEQKAEAGRAGFSGLRATAETDWLVRTSESADRWVEYEIALTDVLAETGCLALCLYDQRICPPAILLSALRTHPIVISENKACENFYFVPPDEARAPRRTSREVERRLHSLRERDNTVRELSGRLMASQEEERRRIARDLHDSTAQELAGLRMGLGVIKRSAKKLDRKALKALTECQELAELCAREIRTLSYLLHPPLLDEFGLVFALRGYIQGFRKRSGLRVKLEADAQLEQARLPQELETNLFRIVQEGLTNIKHHSGSPSATIRLKQMNGDITLEIRDRGRGIAAPVAKAIAKGDFSGLGVGLSGMRERVRQLGGQFQLDTNDAGTNIILALPLTAAREPVDKPLSRAVGSRMMRSEPLYSR